MFKALIQVSLLIQFTTMKHSMLTLILFFTISVCCAQISGSLMQYPDISDTQVCFVYGDDIWIAPKTGGTAIKISSPEGLERNPKFSPDGQMIAYSANYQGNYDVYVIPVNGGIPKRLTYHGMSERVLGWTPDGKSVLFASSRKSGRQRFNQFYAISVDGGSPEKLPIPYGEFATFSPDGKKMAFTARSRVNRNWKRYRGGMAPEIHIFDLTSYETHNITNNPANDELPMWIDNSIYYMSDAGPDKRNNLWKYDLTNDQNIQLTNFKNYDITFPENSSRDIIFEAGGKLYLYNLATSETEELNVQLISDKRGLIPQVKKVEKYMQNATISPDGKRVVVEARGELFNLPATEGFSSNLTNTSGYAERYAAWSPDGKSLAYYSDESGEYQLVIKDMTGKNPDRTITKFTEGFRYSIFWSPDSKKVAFIDQAMNIQYVEVANGKITRIDKGLRLFEGALRNFTVSWSPDSNWLAYTRDAENRQSAIFLYSLEQNKYFQLTSGYYADFMPTFSKDGKHLFFATNRSLQPLYSDLDNTFIYPNATQLAVGTLDAGTTSILAPKNDEFSPAAKEKEETKKAKGEQKSSDSQFTTIQVNGFEDRVEFLDVEPGNIAGLSAIEGKLLFIRYPYSGAPENAKPSLKFYDFDKREVKEIASDIAQYSVSGNGNKILVNQNGSLAVIEPQADQKIEKTVPTDQMMMTVIPKDEWTQIFNDVWRLERDYFYDPEMHGVDWELMRTRYGTLIEQANSRNDVNVIIGDLIAELNASHTYNGGGDAEEAARLNVGYLGADIALENEKYRIKKIIKGAPWDAEPRSPLNQPGVEIKEGEYILAVNGQVIDTSKPIEWAFQGHAGATTQLTVSRNPSFENARQVVVKLMQSESRLRHLAWIEANRKKVEEATNGKIGYIYVRSTGVDGQNELIRQFYGQIHKEGLIIDERFNSGGQIPDRFIELLDRKPLAFWAIRDGKDYAWPPAGHFGPKVMLINGWSGSGGDAFPDYFRKSGLGPLIGTRTWGGLIGISGTPNLIDNGNITVPTFRMYNPDGEWFKEGYGVEPDIKIEQDYQQLAKGHDVQLQAAIEEVLRLLNGDEKFVQPERPNYEARN